MEFNDLKNLILTRKPSLVLHALSIWEKDWSGYYEIINETLRIEDEKILEIALPLAAAYHPQRVANRIVSLLVNSNPTIRRLTVQVIVPKMGKEVEKALKELLASETDSFVLASAVTAAARFNLAVDHIEHLLSHEDVRLRANTVRAIAVIGREKMRVLLEPALKDEAYRVQNEALKGLAQLIPENELESLVVKRLENPDENIRAATAFLAGELPLSRRIAILVDALKDESEKVVICAVRGLCRLNEPIGMRSVLNLFFTTENENLAMTMAKIISQNSTERLLDFAGRSSHPAKAGEKTISRVMQVCMYQKEWEPFLPWILACLRTCDSATRINALKIVARNADYFKNNIENLLQINEATILETAICSLIKWKAGQAAGLDHLQTMLYSGKPAEIEAAVEAFRFDNSLISRNCLRQAVDSGVVLAMNHSEAIKNLTDTPIELPEE
jgi:hypothetical protein